MLCGGQEQQRRSCTQLQVARRPVAARIPLSCGRTTRHVGRDRRAIRLFGWVLIWQIADVVLFIPKFQIAIREHGNSARNSVRLGQAMRDLSPSGKSVMWHNNCKFRSMLNTIDRPSVIALVGSVSNRTCCPSCGRSDICRSRTRGMRDRIVKFVTRCRFYRCLVCDKRFLSYGLRTS